MLAGGGEEDPCANADLFRRWVAYSAVAWPASAGIHTILMNMDVTPGLATLAGPVTTGSRIFSTGGYVGLPFDYWRGDMEFMVEVLASPLHRGAL